MNRAISTTNSEVVIGASTGSRDMVHFSNGQLASLCNLAVDELVRRVGSEAFVNDKVVNGKELLEASAARTLEALGAEFAAALEELEIASKEDTGLRQTLPPAPSV